MKGAGFGPPFSHDDMSNPTWGYRLVDGQIEARLFEDGLPKGWQDSPAKCKPRRRKAG